MRLRLRQRRILEQTGFGENAAHSPEVRGIVDRQQRRAHAATWLAKQVHARLDLRLRRAEDAAPVGANEAGLARATTINKEAASS